MKRSLLILLLTFFASVSYGQINLEDSTVQVIGYWDLNEKQSYTISDEKYNVLNGDTTDRERYKYDVDITVIDSSANSYTFQWDYKNFTFQTENEMMKKILPICQLSKVVVKTDELGSFVEVVNWEQIKDDINKLGVSKKKEYKKLPNINKVLDQIIESFSIKEILQFYTFHGAKYKIGEEVNGKELIPNSFGGDPLDTDRAVWLDEINSDDANYVIQTSETVDSVQLANAKYEYLKKMALTEGQNPPKREDIPAIKQTIFSATRIHDIGWILYSISTNITEENQVQKVEETIIEMN